MQLNHKSPMLQRRISHLRERIRFNALVPHHLPHAVVSPGDTSPLFFLSFVTAVTSHALNFLHELRALRLVLVLDGVSAEMKCAKKAGTLPWLVLG